MNFSWEKFSEALFGKIIPGGYILTGGVVGIHLRMCGKCPVGFVWGIFRGGVIFHKGNVLGE